MNIKDIKSVYFVGAGGIGMSAIARYFIKKGLVVAGYDKTPSDLTRRLEKEGMLIHYEETIDEIPHACKKKESCLVIYTPAIPENHRELQYFRENGFEIQKRAQLAKHCFLDLLLQFLIFFSVAVCPHMKPQDFLKEPIPSKMLRYASMS